MMKVAHPSILILLIMFYFTGPALASNLAEHTATIHASSEFVSRNNQIQNYQDLINVSNDVATLPLTLVVYNGSHEVPSFKWFRITIGGYLVATEKNLNAQNEAIVDLSGRLQGGTTQVLIEAGGVPGSGLWYTVFTPALQLFNITPSSAHPGEQVTLAGNNFSPVAASNQVLFNGTPAQVNKAIPSSLVAVVPNGLSSGIIPVQVRVGNLASQAVPVAVTQKPAPELLKMDLWMLPPGANLTISGRHFGTDASKVKVFFGNIQGQVVSCEPDTLVVTAPEVGFGPQELNIPLWITVDGIKSHNSLPIDIGPKYLGPTIY